MLRKYKDRVIAEIAGHDHFASFRYHTTKNVLGLADDPTIHEENFHNLIVTPSFTPWYQNNPAVSALEINEHQIPHNFRSTYWNLKETIGYTHTTPYEHLVFRDLDYTAKYGLDVLTPNALKAFKDRLLADVEMHNDYMIRKVGLDPKDPEEVNVARDIFLEKGLITKINKPGEAPLYSLWP